MKYSFLVFAFFLCLASFCQSNQNTQCDCSKVIDEVSYFWKNDSLASNGYRYLAYQQLKNCKIVSLDKSLLFGKLGKPNKTLKSIDGESYIYYYLDTQRLPVELGLASACWYISFFYKNDSVFLQYIDVGSIEL